MLHLTTSSPLSSCSFLPIYTSSFPPSPHLHTPFQPLRFRASQARRSAVNLARPSPETRLSRIPVVRSFTTLASARKEDGEGGRDTTHGDGSQSRTEGSRASKARSKNASAVGVNIKQSGHGFAVLAALRSQLEHRSGSSFELDDSSNEKNLYPNKGNQTHADNPSSTNDLTVGALDDIVNSSSFLKRYPDRFASEVRMSEIEGLISCNVIVGDQRSKSPRGAFKIRVSNLPTWFTNDHYQHIMKSIPGITKFNFVSDSSGKCCGYSFCEAPTERSAELAIKSLNRLNIRGKSVKAVLENYHYVKHQAPRVEIDESSLKRFNKEIGAEIPTHNDTTKDQGALTKVGKDIQETYLGSGRGSEGRKEDLKGSIATNNLQCGRKGIPESNEKEISETRSSQTTFRVEKIVDGDDSGKLSLRGQDILLAMRKAAMERANGKENSRGSAGKVKDTASLQETVGIVNVKPIMVRPEWAVQIENLEKHIKELKTSPIL